MILSEANVVPECIRAEIEAAQAETPAERVVREMRERSEGMQILYDMHRARRETITVNMDALLSRDDPDPTDA